MKKYLTVGTDVIRSNLFVSVCDINNCSEVKPSGGLWLTEFDTNFTSYNCWVDYMLRNPYLLFYKNKSNNPFKQLCCIVSLKDNANIFLLNDKEKFQFFLKNFSNGLGGFLFEKLSHYYDGVFIKLMFDLDIDKDIRKMFYDFGVNTLILFNCDCIDYYYSGVVDIETFDYEYGYNIECGYYNIRWDNTKKFVSDAKNMDTGIKKLYKRRYFK